MCKAAAERGFFRALQEIRQARAVADRPGVEAGAAEVASQARASLGSLGSFFPAVVATSTPPIPSRSNPLGTPPSARPDRAEAARGPGFGAFDVPITIGRAR